ncbi:hypothetical protein Tco_1348958 [Tanacetum coccineum]
MRMASTAAKPYQGDSLEFYLVILMVAAIGSRQVKIQSHMLILDRQNDKVLKSNNFKEVSVTLILNVFLEVTELKNFKKDVLFKLSRPRNNNSMGMSVQKSKVHKTATRSKDDDKRLCLLDDLKEVQDHIQVKPIRTSSRLKYGYVKYYKKTVKNGQRRTRERMSDQEAKEIKAEARKIMPQPSTVNCS